MPQLDPRSAERRLVRLAAWFLAHGPATRAEVYAEFSKDYTGDAQAKEKKWTRDKKDLERLGVPLRFSEDEGGKYRIEPGSFYLPKLSFTPAEAAVLAIAARAGLRDSEHPLHDDLEAALRKLLVGSAGFPPRAVDVEPAREPVTPAALRRWLEKIVEAVEDEKVLHIAYWVPARDEVTERNISPYGYALRRGDWLLVGYCHTRKSIRVFYLRRVRELKLAKAKKGEKLDYAKRPPGFDIRKWSRQAPWDYVSHEPVPARVRFRGSLAKIAAKLVPDAKLSTEPDNSRVARFDVRNVYGLARQSLAWGPEAEIIEPTEARTRAREMLASIAGQRGAP